MMKKGLLTLVTLAATLMAMAQGSKEAKYGVDSIKTLEKTVIYQSFYEQKDYEKAYPHWKYLIENAPKFQVRPYKRGSIILNYLYKKTKDKKYVKELMDLWDLRIKYWSHYKHYDKAYCLGRKGYYLFRLQNNDVNELKRSYDIMMTSINTAGVKSEATVIDAAMNATRLLYKQNKIDKNTVIKNFFKFNELINDIYTVEHKQSKLDKIGKARNNVQKYFIISKAANCDDLENIFKSQYEANKDNKKVLESIVSVLNRFECTGSKLYANIAESLYKIGPTSKAALSLGVRYLKAKDLTQARKYMQEASRLETKDKTLKAYIHYMLANIYLGQKNYSKARLAVRNALKIRPDWGAPKLFLARVYLSSASKGDVLKTSKTIWAAMDQSMRAKNDPEEVLKVKKFLRECNKYLPSCDDIFFHGLKKGQKVEVGGWIGGTTTVRCKK